MAFFSIIWKDTKNESDGLGNAVSLFMNENIDVIFGSPSSTGNAHLKLDLFKYTKTSRLS